MSDDLPSIISEWFGSRRGDFGFSPRVDADPSITAPGSIERIEEYRQRVASGQPIFAVGDRVIGTPKAYQESAVRFAERSTRAGAYLFDSLFGYRYRYERKLSAKPGRRVLFVGYRPDAEFDREAVAYCLLNRWHHVSVVNLYSTLDSRPCADQVDPVGPANDIVIRSELAKASVVIAAWGDVLAFNDRERGARINAISHRILDGVQVRCFGQNDCSTEPIDAGSPLVKMDRLDLREFGDREHDDDGE